MKLLAISGRKQSGKTTLADFILRNRKEFFGVEHGISLGWATALKIELSDKFNIPMRLLEGTDEDKNTLTTVRWKDLPHFSRLNPVELEINPEDFLTVRNLLQQWGTEVNRYTDPDIWVRVTMRNIERGKYDVVILNDTRFPNEVEAIKKIGGKVIRLTRNGKVPATHASEISLDKDNYDWSNFDAIIENERMNVSGKERVMKNLLEQWGWKNP